MDTVFGAPEQPAALSAALVPDDDGKAASIRNRVAAVAANAAARTAVVAVPTAPPPATTVAAQRAADALKKRVARVKAAPIGSEENLRDLVANVNAPLVLRKAAESRLESLAGLAQTTQKATAARVQAQ